MIQIHSWLSIIPETLYFNDNYEGVQCNGDIFFRNLLLMVLSYISLFLIPCHILPFVIVDQ